ncbi:hypothetical protein LB507_009131 [Fusarium sp. FIESC RH6]|nr:hypothetical protein LB507_009131 [Fusarium sp. FIESC RH6]
MSSSKKDQDSPELRAAQGEIDKPVQTAMPEGGTLLTERPPVSEEHLEGWLAEFAEEVARFHGMARSHHDFLPPDPLISYREIEDRHARVIVLENDIKIDEQELKMSGEDLVATLMVDLEDLQEGGPLAVGEDFPNVPSEIETLEVIAKFSQHYMLHLDPDNLEDPRWQHAIFVPLEEQPELNDEMYAKGDPHAINKAIAYRNRFKTMEHLQPIRRSTVKSEEAKCRSRDNGRCPLTDKPSSLIFWFMPFTWNDTVEHMNALGELCCGSFDLAGVSLFEGLTPPCNVSALGGSHKVWNMLLVDKDLHPYLKLGLCAFKHFASKALNGGEVKVTLQFQWMPILRLRYGRTMSLDTSKPNDDFEKLVRDILHFRQGPQVTEEYGKVMDKDGNPIESGRLVHITMSEEDAKQFVAAVKVHWACVLFTALCGGAGRAWLSSGEASKDEPIEE